MRAVEDAVRARNELGPDLHRRLRHRPASAARASSSWRTCSPSTSTPGSRSTWVPARGRMLIEFASLEDLERIYRAMTETEAEAERTED